MGTVENNIQKAVCDYLALRKYFFWRSNNMPVYDSTRKQYRAMPVYSMKGVPDIILIKDGFFIGIEIKVKGKYLSKDQKKFKELCKENGAEYYTIRSIDDLIEVGL